MQAQNMMWAPAFATAASSVANVGINVLLIRWYGFDGAAAAFSVTRVLLFLLLAGKAMALRERVLGGLTAPSIAHDTRIAGGGHVCACLPRGPSVDAHCSHG